MRVMRWWRSAVGSRSARASAALLGALALVALPAGAAAADRVYWGNETAKTISFAELSGAGGGNLPVIGGLVEYPQGLAIDSASGRIYWTNYGGPKEGIYSAGLDGAGALALNTLGATVNSAYGLAIDPLGGRVWWGNAPAGPDDISFARLDGSGGANLNTAGATALDNPLGVAVDPAGGRIFWANYGANKISFARLDGSGGGDVNTAGATVDRPLGIAVDAAGGRVFWTNAGAQTVSFARLDGSGGANLNTSGAVVKSPAGVAVDAAAGRVYWANNPAGISFARLDGTGGADLNVTGAAPGEASFPILHRSPAVAALPQVAVDRGRGSTLTCSGAAWAPDDLGAFLYRAPSSTALGWTRDGVPVDGAEGPTLRPRTTGSYRCLASATNAAGTSVQASEPRLIQTAAIRRLTLRPRAFRAVAGGGGAASASRAKTRRGATVRFRLNEGARVVLRVMRKRGSRPPKAVKGRLVRTRPAGANAIRFDGRVDGRTLPPGRYVLVATPTGVGKAGPARRAAFQVLAP